MTTTQILTYLIAIAAGFGAGWFAKGKWGENAPKVTTDEKED